MRVIQAAPVRRWSLRRPGQSVSRTARIERLGLLATSLVLVLGLWITYLGQASEFPRCVEKPTTASSGACVVNLATVRDSGELVPLLTMFNDPGERKTVAVALVERLTRP